MLGCQQGSERGHVIKMSMTELKYDTIDEIRVKQGKTKRNKTIQYNTKQFNTMQSKRNIRKTRQNKIDAIQYDHGLEKKRIR